MRYSSFRFFALLATTAMAATTPPSPTQWASLNQTVVGRLFRGVPLAMPCYNDYNGTTKRVNSTDCFTVQSGYDSGEYITSQYGGFMSPSWGTCQATGQGCTLDYNNPGAFSPTNGVCYQGSVSPYYIKVQEVSDIQAALEFSRQTGYPLSIKNSGHDYSGRSSAPGSLALWTHNVQPAPKLVRGFIPDGCSAPVGDGVTFGAGQGFAGLYNFAEANNITIVGGASGTVGPAGGWISGGGHSALTTTMGLGVDNVLQIRAVLPNGSYVTANECQNPDLWFAWRGGGGSTFGVNFEMTTRAWPKVQLQLAYFAFTTASPAQVSLFMALLIQNANKWASEGWGGYIFPGVYTGQVSGMILVTPKLTLAKAQASMQPISNFVKSQGNLATGSIVYTAPSFGHVFQNFLLPNGEKIGISNAIGSRLIPSSQFRGAANQSALLAALNKMVSLISYPLEGTSDPDAITYGAPVQILVTCPSLFPTTAANDTSAVSPAWRDATWHVLGLEGFKNNASAAQIQKVFSTTHQIAETLRALAPNSGAYLNEADVFQSDAEFAFWGKNYDRLLRIKKELDPGNLLTCWGAIGWDKTDAQRYGCYPQI